MTSMRISRPERALRRVAVELRVGGPVSTATGSGSGAGAWSALRSAAGWLRSSSRDRGAGRSSASGIDDEATLGRCELRHDATDRRHEHLAPQARR